MQFFRDVFSDGYKYIGAIAPALSITYTACKLFDVSLAGLRELSYAWAFLPLLVWIIIAYINRWFIFRHMIDEYAHGLNLEKIHAYVNPNEGALGQYQLIFRNTINKNIRYELESIKINSIELEGNFTNRGGIIRPQTSEIFYLPSSPVLNDDQLDLIIKYGPSKKPFLKKWERSAIIQLQQSGLVYTNIKDEEIDLSI